MSNQKDSLSRGIELISEKKYGDSIKFLDEATQLDPDNFYAWYNKAYAFSMLENNKKVIDCLNEAIRIRPNFPKSWVNKGVALRFLRRFDNAISCFDKALELDPYDVDSLYHKGLSLGCLGKHENAIDCFDSAIELYKAHEKDNKFISEKAISFYQSGTIAEALFTKGAALGALGKHEAALKCYDEAIKINPEIKEAWFNKGTSFIALGKYDIGIECYNKAIKIDPKFKEALFNKGLVCIKLRQFELAINCFDDVLRLTPENEEAWLSKGVAFGELKRFKEALECFDEALRINPNYAGAFSNKGVVYTALGEPEKAKECFNFAIKSDPNDASAYGNWGLLLLNQQKYNDASTYLKRSSELFLIMGRKTDFEIANKYNSCAINAKDLTSRLQELDYQILCYLKNKNIKKTKENNSRLLYQIGTLISEFDNKEIPQEARELLVEKSRYLESILQEFESRDSNARGLNDAR